MVDYGRVSIRGPGGKRLVVDRGEIVEPEELRDLGPRIAKEVALASLAERKIWKMPYSTRGHRKPQVRE